MEENMAREQVREIPLIPTPEEKKKIRKQYTKAGLMGLLMFVLFHGIGFIIQRAYVLIQLSNGLTKEEILELTKGMSLHTLLLNLAIYAVAYPIILLCLKGVSKYKIKDFMNFKTLNAKTVLKYIPMGFLFIYGGGMITVVLNTIANNLGYNLIAVDTSTIPNDIPSRIAATLMMCILAPVLEEIVFRGFVMKGFMGVSPKFAIIASAILFGLMHGNIVQAIGAGFMGVMLGYVAYKTGSILTGILMHMACNIMGTGLGMLMSTMTEKFGEVKGPMIAGLISSGWMIFIVTIGIICIVVNKHNAMKLKENPVQKQRTWKLWFRTWPIYVFLALCSVVTVMSITPLKEGNSIVDQQKEMQDKMQEDLFGNLEDELKEALGDEEGEKMYDMLFGK